MDEPSLQDRIAQAVVDLGAWLETMRQPGGYGGPVAHWWQNRFQYTGPGLDWRYEGILIGYATLHEKTGDAAWRGRLDVAADDVIAGQRPDGSYRASRFEMNPDTLGTPHEAAATHGLLAAQPHLSNGEKAVEVARRNLDNLVEKLWDGRGFNDRPGVSGRVPNKLATLAHALMCYVRLTGDGGYLPYAKAALDDVLRYQMAQGPNVGAVHQYAPGGAAGDGRFFPYYNARCVPALVLGADLLGDERYLEAARGIKSFLDGTMHHDGSWPQIVYVNGRRAAWPRWLAGTADILLAYGSLGEAMPDVALRRLLDSQLPSGGFRTATGFQAQIRQAAPSAADYRDVVPVVGWNDKALRLLATMLPSPTTLPAPETAATELPVTVGAAPALFRESPEAMELRIGHEAAYAWDKHAPWATTANGQVNVR